MKVSEHYSKAAEPLISYEIIPPRRGGSIDDILGIVETLLPYDPPFIDVTSHAAEAYFEEMPGNVMRRHVKRKRPGTIGLCAAIQYRYGIDAVPHILCQGFTREETEDALIELHYLGIRNVLAVRGDDVGSVKAMRPDRSVNGYASDLVSQIVAMNEGRYLEDLVDARPTDFCIGVGGYPEKHVEAPNLAWDIANLGRKVDAGADYVVTQMFFDNSHYFRFVDLCRQAGITVPIVPGLKILTTTNHLQSLPRTFGAEIPEALAEEVRAVDSNTMAADIGVAWAREQAGELLEANVPGLHFYIMSTANHVVRVVEGIR
jgi:methylenetetrahydrofolate reductase (NADPH)